jgi:hypothetical protein
VKSVEKRALADLNFKTSDNARASTHQYNLSTCTECAAAQAAGFDDNKAKLIHHEPHPSPKVTAHNLASFSDTNTIVLFLLK